jgi:thiamine biosynthesis lipoprotein
MLSLSVLIGGKLHAGASEANLTEFQYTQLIMGVQARIVVYAQDEAQAKRACAAAFQRMADLEQIMSDYRPTSELMQLCAKAGGPPVKISDDLYLVLERALQVAERSEGAFDPTIGPMVALWRHARRSGQFPAPQEREQARAVVGWRKVRLDPRERAAQLLTAGMRLDLGGIAKGYAGDQGQRELKKHGIRSAMIEIGGDIVVSDAPPGKKGWRIEIPNAAGTESPRIEHFRNVGISTSGDTEQFVEFDGKRYSHIVDPRTGLGLTTRIAVTIVAADGLTSDSLSTAVSVLGAERGRALARFYRARAVYIRYPKDEAIYAMMRRSTR